MSSSLISQLTTSFGNSSLASLSDDDVFDESTGNSPNTQQHMQFHFLPSQLAQFQQSALQQTQGQLQLQQLQQQQQQQQQQLHQQQVQQHHHQQAPHHHHQPHQQQQQHHHHQPQQQHPLFLQHQRYPQYRPQIAQFPQPAAHPYVSPVYPIIDPWDAWLSLSPFNQPRGSPMFDFTVDPWSASSHHHSRSGQRRKKSSGSSHASPVEKKVEEVDVTTLSPRDAILKAKVRLANLVEWKTYTKNNAWTPEIVLGEPFVVPINIKFLQLVPTARYLISLSFALREDTPGLMSFSDESLQWNSIEGAVHQAPRKQGTSGSSATSDNKVKVEVVLTEAPPQNTIKLNNGKPLTGEELMDSPKEFSGLVVAHQPENPNQIRLRPNYKYSPCLYLTLLSDYTDDDEDSSDKSDNGGDDGPYTMAFTRKVMIHDIKMVPVEQLHNPLLGSTLSPSDKSSSSSSSSS
ncbi:uncharacterized protein LOC135807181 [Sycon ciliatum]|uniref:uncharacterized protein LOC135807181 n=1 Tax=Sycon ciliatum TaxID=27933 RepID=UPI0031F60AC9